MNLSHLPSCLRSIIEQQFAVSTTHRRFLEQRFADLSDDEAQLLEYLAESIRRIAGDDLSVHCADYDWLTTQMLEEEIYFRRHGRYRLTSFADACEQVYHDTEYMTRYMNGVLMTQLFWANHTRMYGFFLSGLLERSPDAAEFLEIGPGHGLYLAGAARHPRVAHATGWDISAASIAETRQTLQRLDVTADLEQRDLLALTGDEPKFDLIVCSEVLEHLEDPTPPLQAMKRLLKPGGLIFVHVPVNSPAPDHLYLWTSPEAAVRFVVDCGLEVVEQQFHPVTNCTLERARKHQLTISVGVVARRAS